MRKLINLFENDYDDEALLYNNLAKLFNVSEDPYLIHDAIVFFKMEDIVLQLFKGWVKDQKDYYKNYLQAYNDDPSDKLDDTIKTKDYLKMLEEILGPESDGNDDHHYYVTTLLTRASERIKHFFEDELAKTYLDATGQIYEDLNFLNYQIGEAIRKFQDVYGRSADPFKYMSTVDLLGFGESL